MSESERRDNRRWFTLGAVAALVIAVIFATVGDGVDASDRDGAQRFVLEHFHTLTWALLAAAFGVAAFAGRWARGSSWLAGGALGCYATFLFTAIVPD